MHELTYFDALPNSIKLIEFLSALTRDETYNCATFAAISCAATIKYSNFNVPVITPSAAFLKLYIYIYKIII